MKIIHLIMSDHGGGAATNTNRLIRELDEQHHIVVVLTNKQRGFIKESTNVTIHYFDVKRKLSDIGRIKRLLARHKITVITNGFGCLIIGYYIRLHKISTKWLHVTRGANFHGRLSLIKWLFYKYISLTNVPIKFIFVSDSEKSSFCNRLIIGKNNQLVNNSVIIGNGLPTEQFRNVNIKKHDQKYKILVVSRVCDQKDIFGLIKLIHGALLLGLLPKNLQVCIYGSTGDKRYHDKCIRLINSLDLTNNFVFFGETQINWSNLSEYRFLLHNAKFEGLATVLSEASAAGILYLTRQVVGTIDFKTSHNECLFFNNYQSFLAGLKYVNHVLEKDTMLHEWILKNNQERVKSLLNIQTTGKQMLDLITDA